MAVSILKSENVSISERRYVRHTFNQDDKVSRYSHGPLWPTSAADPTARERLAG